MRAGTAWQTRRERATSFFFDIDRPTAPSLTSSQAVTRLLAAEDGPRFREDKGWIPAISRRRSPFGLFWHCVAIKTRSIPAKTACSWGKLVNLSTR